VQRSVHSTLIVSGHYLCMIAHSCHVRRYLIAWRRGCAQGVWPGCSQPAGQHRATASRYTQHTPSDLRAAPFRTQIAIAVLIATLPVARLEPEASGVCMWHICFCHAVERSRVRRNDDCWGHVAGSCVHINLSRLSCCTSLVACRGCVLAAHDRDPSQHVCQEIRHLVFTPKSMLHSMHQRSACCTL
jgi:hypothetical protein